MRDNLVLENTAAIPPKSGYGQQYGKLDGLVSPVPDPKVLQLHTNSTLLTNGASD